MRKRIPFLSFLSLFLGLSLCIVLFIIVSSLSSLPQRAQRVFGPPSPTLSIGDEIYLSALLLTKRNELTTPLYSTDQQREFEIQLGEPTNQVIQRLKREGFIASEDAFQAYLEYSGLDTSLQAGMHTLSSSMTPLEIAHALQDATPSHVTFISLPGWRLEEVAAAIPTSGLQFTSSEFLVVAKSPNLDLGEWGIPPAASVEGLLFPDTYEIRRDLTPQAFIATLIQRLQVNLSNDMKHGFEQQSLDIYQAVILASIIERESILDDEMPLIASVFLNRLADGMKLDSDTTVQYALGYDSTQKTWWTNPLTVDDLRINSPYNTYLHAGLPPGPIANPGMNGLKAVAFPEKTDYYYFRTSCDKSGKHVFAKTFQEHLNNACP